MGLILGLIFANGIGTIAHAQAYLPYYDNDMVFPEGYVFEAATFADFMNLFYPFMSSITPSEIIDQTSYDAFILANGPTGQPTQPIVPQNSCVNFKTDYQFPIQPNITNTVYGDTTDEWSKFNGNTSLFMDDLCERAKSGAMNSCQKKKVNTSVSSLSIAQGICSIACGVVNFGVACQAHPEIRDRGTVCSEANKSSEYLGISGLSWCSVTVAGVVRGTLDCHCGAN